MEAENKKQKHNNWVSAIIHIGTKIRNSQKNKFYMDNFLKKKKKNIHSFKNCQAPKGLLPCKINRIDIGMAHIF